jgi:imidazolonepropionase-like amidohydrolase
VLADHEALRTAEAAVGTNLHNVKTLYVAGIHIGFGTDSGASPLRIAGFAEHRELRLLTDAGLTPLQAITTATKNAATLLGLEDRGVLAAGKLADLIVVDGNPAVDIGSADRIVAVWHRGRQVSGSVLDFTP